MSLFKIVVWIVLGVVCVVQFVQAGPLTEKVVQRGDNVEIVCDASSGQSIKWRKNNKPLDLAIARYSLTHDGTLQISGCRFEDEGRYQCELEGSAENLPTTVTLLHIEGPPSIPKDAANEVKVNRGSNINVSCPVQGYPIPSIVWNLDEGLQSRVIRQGGTTLSLAGVVKNTNFTCVATNRLGSVEHSIEVIVKEESVNVAVVVILVLLAALVLVVVLVPVCRSNFRKTMTVA